MPEFMNKHAKFNILALASSVCIEGGIARFNNDFFESLACSEQVNKIYIISRDNKKKKYTNEKITFISNSSSKWDLAFYFLFFLLKKKEINLVFCGHMRLLPLMSFVLCIRKLPIWLHVHGIEASDTRGWLIKKILKYMTLVTCASRYTRRELCSWASIETEYVKVLPNTYDERYKPGAKDKELLEKYRLEGKYVLLTVSRLLKTERYKGHEKVIDAVARLSQVFPDLIYIIVGEGDYRSELEKKVFQMGIKKNVIFASVPNNELPSFYQTADLFVMPSQGEGFGIVFLEALASGLPVIAGNRDGSVDALQEGKLGILIDPDDVEILYETLHSFVYSKAAFYFKLSNQVKVYSKENFRSYCEGLLSNLNFA